MKVYLFPGLGADKRMYHPQIDVIPGAEVLEHLKPVKGETISGYAKRLIASIDTSQPFIFVGTSLGGMVAIELSKYVSPQKIILIASVKSRDELPGFIRAMRYLNLHRTIPGGLYKKLNNIAARRLDSRGDSPVADLIKEMTNDASPEFISWAINAVINWQPEGEIKHKIIHIHGTNDQLFPIERIKNPIAIENGSHVMNLTMSERVNKALLEALGI